MWFLVAFIVSVAYIIGYWRGIEAAKQQIRDDFNEIFGGESEELPNEDISSSKQA